MGLQLQWNLYTATTKFCGLSRQVVSQDRENKHDFVKTAREVLKFMCFSKASPVSLYRFHCIAPIFTIFWNLFWGHIQRNDMAADNLVADSI